MSEYGYLPVRFFGCHDFRVAVLSVCEQSTEKEVCMLFAGEQAPLLSTRDQVQPVVLQPVPFSAVGFFGPKLNWFSLPSAHPIDADQRSASMT